MGPESLHCHVDDCAHESNSKFETQTQPGWQTALFPDEFDSDLTFESFFCKIKYVQIGEL